MNENKIETNILSRFYLIGPNLRPFGLFSIRSIVRIGLVPMLISTMTTFCATNHIAT